MQRVAHLSRHLLHPSAAASKNDERMPVALVIGAGAGIGQAVAAKFAMEGMHAVCVRRGKGPNRLLTEDDDVQGKMSKFISQIENAGGKASALWYDGTDPKQVAECVKLVEETIGPIHFACYNIGASSGQRTIAKTSYKLMVS